ncbi:hypothetical protein [Tardiphaga sp. 768_D3_N2_1]|uniref:hypothetical protein n=1 Tax=Tardiphaga sp. 768_D3_N2_1 TaxID=3240783 RepID=UPI003F897D73
MDRREHPAQWARPGAEDCELLVRGVQNTVERTINIPEINCELFDKSPYDPLKNSPPEMGQDGSKLFIVFARPMTPSSSACVWTSQKSGFCSQRSLM